MEGLANKWKCWAWQPNLRELAHPDRMQSIRQAARQTIVEQYEVQQSLRQYQAVISGLLKPVVRGVKQPVGM